MKRAALKRVGEHSERERERLSLCLLTLTGLNTQSCRTERGMGGVERRFKVELIGKDDATKEMRG